MESDGEESEQAASQAAEWLAAAWNGLAHDAFAGVCFCSGRTWPCQGAAIVTSELMSYKNSTGRHVQPGARHAQVVVTALDMSGQPMLSTRAKNIRALHNGFSQPPLRVYNRGHNPRARVLCLCWPCARVHFTCLRVACPSLYVCHACACLCVSCPCLRKLALFIVCLVQMISAPPSRSEPKRHSLSHLT